jgi:hypothetical protein
MDELFRVLKKEGVFGALAPDFEFAVKNILII